MLEFGMTGLPESPSSSWLYWPKEHEGLWIVRFRLTWMWYVAWAVSWCFVSVSWETSVPLSTFMRSSKETRNLQGNMKYKKTECKDPVKRCKRCSGGKESAEVGTITLHQGNKTVADPQQTSAIWQVPERCGCVKAL